MTTWSDYFDIGNDTERWWAETVKHAIRLRHTPRSKLHDFTSVEGSEKMYFDVKFHRTKYRVAGWIEVASRGSLTGIFKNAEIDGRHSMLVILDAGKFYVLDVNKISASIRSAELKLVHSSVSDDMGNEASMSSVVINGWDDPRFLLFQGDMDIKNWKPQTEIGKSLNISRWIAGGCALP